LLGPVVLDPVGETTTMRTLPASRLRSACRSNVPMDWLEVLRRTPR
jgi:hypothetical protein